MSDDPSGRVLSRREVVSRFGRPRDDRVVFTNGCFDLVHRGHVACLSAAAALGDRLVVAVNSDASVRRLKGAGRPVTPEEDRAYVLAGLRAVDAVTIFGEDTPLRLIEELEPDVLVKGGDYGPEEVVGREVVERAGGEVRLLPLEPGRSTTGLIRRIREARPRILVATRNPHKMEEIRDLLGDLAVDFLSPAEAGLERREEEKGIEVHDTFDANAAAKARHFRERSGGLPTVADDSGLCVDALDGGPGVHTKRFAPAEMVERHGRDEANNRHLLERLEGVPPEERGAHYHCSVAVETADESFVVQGKVFGRIATEPRGEGGFGYDPLFLLPDRGETFGELPAEVKQRTSHRARAFRKLRPWLERLVERRGG